MANQLMVQGSRIKLIATNFRGWSISAFFSCAGLSLGLALASGYAIADAWTVERALHAALATHPSIEARRAEEAAARSTREGAEWQRYPSPTLEAGRDNKGVSTSVLRIDQPLWTGGRITADIKAARHREQASAFATGETRDDLALRVIAAMSEAIRFHRRAQIARNNVEEHERLRDMMLRRVQQQVSPPVDLQLAESRLGASMAELHANEQQYQDALNQLGQLTGEKIDAIEGADLAAVVKSLPASIEEASSDAEAISSTLRRLSAEAEASDAEIQSRRAAYWPQFFLRLESQFSPVSDQRGMIILQAQPGAGLSASSAVATAQARKEAVLAQRAATLRELRERVALDWSELASAQKRRMSALQSRGAANEVASSYARLFVAGRRNWLDVLNAVRETAQAEFTLADIEAQLWSAALRLKWRTGRLALQSSAAQ